jgi:hypothetical protein
MRVFEMNDRFRMRGLFPADLKLQSFQPFVHIFQKAAHAVDLPFNPEYDKGENKPEHGKKKTQN